MVLTTPESHFTREPAAPSRGSEHGLAGAMYEFGRVVVQALALPFDAMRAQYARAAQVGLIERSMLAGRDFERALGSLEKFFLGPWARRV